MKKVTFQLALSLILILIMPILALFLITPVFAQTGSGPGPDLQSPIGSFFEQLAQAFGGQIVTILALAGAQVLLAIAVSLKNKLFEWQKLGDFFASIIVPKLIGWLACVILARFVVADYIPADLQLIPQGIESIAFGAVLLSFGGAILANLKALEILPTGISSVLTRVGIPDKAKPIDPNKAMLNDRLNKIV